MTSLSVRSIESGYGEVQILWGASVELGPGKLTTILGSNGAGKTTLLRTITGLLPAWKGNVLLDDRDVTRLPPHDKAEQGLVLVPEGRQLFSTMTVVENLEMGATPKHARAGMRATIDQVFGLFPRLAERRTQLAGTLSGGEQQMLAIARGLMARPRLLVLDEPSLGLSPLLVRTIFDTIVQINAQGISVLLVEQNVYQSLRIAARGYVLETGRIALSGTGSELLSNDQVKSAFLGA